MVFLDELYTNTTIDIIVSQESAEREGAYSVHVVTKNLQTHTVFSKLSTGFHSTVPLAMKRMLAVLRERAAYAVSKSFLRACLRTILRGTGSNMATERYVDSDDENVSSTNISRGIHDLDWD